MAKKKEVIRRDPFVERTLRLLEFMRRHRRWSVSLGIFVLLLVLSAAFLSYHRQAEDERLQESLSRGMKAYKEGRLEEAERAFADLKGEGRLGRLASLYEARLKSMKGQREEARKILERLRQDGDPVIRLLAEQTLKQGGL
jgi:uncharacterized protein HemY